MLKTLIQVQDEQEAKDKKEEQAGDLYAGARAGAGGGNQLVDHAEDARFNYYMGWFNLAMAAFDVVSVLKPLKALNTRKAMKGVRGVDALKDVGASAIVGFDKAMELQKAGKVDEAAKLLAKLKGQLDPKVYEETLDLFQRATTLQEAFGKGSKLSKEARSILSGCSPKAMRELAALGDEFSESFARFFKQFSSQLDPKLAQAMTDDLGPLALRRLAADMEPEELVKLYQRSDGKSLRELVGKGMTGQGAENLLTSLQTAIRTGDLSSETTRQTIAKLNALGGTSPMAHTLADSLLQKVGNDWEALRKAFKSEPDALDFMTRWREHKVNSLLAEVKAGKKKYADIDWSAFGSRTPTSDYDLTVTGSHCGEFVEDFNKSFKSRYGRNSAGYFDTNLYGEPIGVLPGKGSAGDDLVTRMTKHLDNKEAVKAIRDAVEPAQREMAWIQMRRNMSAQEWEAMTKRLIDANPDLAESISRASKRFDALETERLAQVERNMGASKYASPGANKTDIKSVIAKEPDRLVDASNELYTRKLQKLQALRAQADKLIADGASPDKIKAITEEIMEEQSKALHYASEAYISEGAIRHVPGNMQQQLGLELTKSQVTDSIIEQYGYFHHKVAGHASSPAEGLVKGSKYLERLGDGAKLLHTKGAARFTKLGEDLNAVRKSAKLSASERSRRIQKALSDAGFRTPEEALDAVKQLFQDAMTR